MFERFLHPPVLAIGIPEALHQELAEEPLAPVDARLSVSETPSHA